MYKDIPTHNDEHRYIRTLILIGDPGIQGDTGSRGFPGEYQLT